uniref:Uncharacterized protein n=1 Tax=Oryza barthii TaxID=65489 RepID=A0A0D3H7M9_9ORYZ
MVRRECRWRDRKAGGARGGGRRGCGRRHARRRPSAPREKVDHDGKASGARGGGRRCCGSDQATAPPPTSPPPPLHLAEARPPLTGVVAWEEARRPTRSAEVANVGSEVRAASLGAMKLGNNNTLQFLRSVDVSYVQEVVLWRLGLMFKVDNRCLARFCDVVGNDDLIAVELELLCR